MEALYLLVPLSLAVVALAAWIFLRMSDSGQFDDMEGPAHSILHDDDRPAPTGTTTSRLAFDKRQNQSVAGSR